MRITELPQAASVAQTDDLAIDVPGGKTYRVPRSILAPAPYIVTIPTGQWSGSGSDRYITVTASNVTADAMLYPFYDNASAALLNGPVWVIPAAGSFTIHTSAIPSGTVTISVLLAGIVGEAQYQVLADVYSTSQVDSKIAQSTATLTKRFNMTSSGTDRNAVLHAWMNTIHSQLTLGEEACLTGIFQSTMYFGLISKVTNSVIMGRMFTPNSDSGFYFRDGINDNTATSSDIQSTAFEVTTVTGTTTADGLLRLNMTTWQHIIVELYSRNHICLLYPDDGGNYYVKVLDYNLAKVASTSVSVGVRYKTIL